jgi:hypothetical protein
MWSGRPEQDMSWHLGLWSKPGKTDARVTRMNYESAGTATLRTLAPDSAEM